MIADVTPTVRGSFEFVALTSVSRARRCSHVPCTRCGGHQTSCCPMNYPACACTPQATLKVKHG
ncbi:MAG: hypothetical protein ACHREM_02295 [Polyangiales bacterium]